MYTIFLSSPFSLYIFSFSLYVFYTSTLSITFFFSFLLPLLRLSVIVHLTLFSLFLSKLLLTAKG